MPNKASAKKRMRQNEKRRMKNRIEKRTVKTYIKNVLSLLQAKEIDESALKEAVSKAFAKIDKAWKHGVFHKNKAARLKSRLMSKINRALSQKQTA